MATTRRITDLTKALDFAQAEAQKLAEVVWVESRGGWFSFTVGGDPSPMSLAAWRVYPGGRVEEFKGEALRQWRRSGQTDKP